MYVAGLFFHIPHHLPQYTEAHCWHCQRHRLSVTNCSSASEQREKIGHFPTSNIFKDDRGLTGWKNFKIIFKMIHRKHIFCPFCFKKCTLVWVETNPIYFGNCLYRFDHFDLFHHHNQEPEAQDRIRSHLLIFPQRPWNHPRLNSGELNAWQALSVAVTS